MTTIRILALLVSTTAAIAICPITLGAQSATPANKSDSVLIQVSLQKCSYAVGEKPIAVLKIENTGSQPIWFSDMPYRERVHVTSKDGEPRKTELYRHILGDFRSGDGPDLTPGPVAGRSIAPGSSYFQKWDLTGYYDLSAPGDYSVYLEIYDPAGPADGSGHWLRTNTVKFEIHARMQ